jgi:hypothetical protein
MSSCWPRSPENVRRSWRSAAARCCSTSSQRGSDERAAVAVRSPPLRGRTDRRPARASAEAPASRPVRPAPTRLRERLVLFARSCPDRCSCTSAHFWTPYAQVEIRSANCRCSSASSLPCPTARQAIANGEGCEPRFAQRRRRRRRPSGRPTLQRRGTCPPSPSPEGTRSGSSPPSITGPATRTSRQAPMSGRRAQRARSTATKSGRPGGSASSRDGRTQHPPLPLRPVHAGARGRRAPGPAARLRALLPRVEAPGAWPPCLHSRPPFGRTTVLRTTSERQRALLGSVRRVRGRQR